MKEKRIPDCLARHYTKSDILFCGFYNEPLTPDRKRCETCEHVGGGDRIISVADDGSEIIETSPNGEEEDDDIDE